jgi:hypothetical protein
MHGTIEKKKKRRITARNPIEATIACQPFTGGEGTHITNGVMRNFSQEGSYIETYRNYKSGTILFIRIVHYPPIPTSTVDKERPRSICLAEVKWRQELVDDNTTRFGIGLRYID